MPYSSSYPRSYTETHNTEGTKMSYTLSLQMPGSTRVIRRPLFRSTSRHAPRTLAMQAADAVRHYARSRGVHVLAVEWSIEGSAV